MKRRSLTRGLIEGALFSLLVCAVLSGSFDLGTAADRGWAPVVVLAAEEKLAQQPAPSRAAPAIEQAPQAAKSSPVEVAPARSPASALPERNAAAGAKSESVPPDAAKLVQRPESSVREPGSDPAMKSLDAAGTGASPAQQYCANIADAAADARFAWQKNTLAEVQQEVDRRVAMLEAKIAEYQKWLARRDEFSKKANQSLVNIYSRMRPDAAALQLVKMDEETAAAVLIKLDARIASLILNEIPPAQAARLAGTIAGAARIPPDRKKS
jgi:flagellar motility protein MotE (MotC chaperone)